MSLRARIEAVIYAAEEPVSLAQLSALFGAEALEGRDRDAAAVAGDLFAGVDAAPEQPVGIEPGDAGIEPGDAGIEQAVEHPEQVTDSQADGFAPEPEAEDQGRNGLAAQREGAESTGSPDAASLGGDEQRRLSRQRDREAREQIRTILNELIAEYDRGDRGVEIREIAGGYRVATRPEYHDAVRSFIKGLKPVMKLSLQALETLAVIAYKQPVTAPEISEIRGVDSGGVLGSLISRKLVTTAGRKQVIGRPILYKTTKEFLLRFGLRDLGELPSMEEFEKMAGELIEPEQADQATQLALAEDSFEPGTTGEPALNQVSGETLMQTELAQGPEDGKDVQNAAEPAERFEQIEAEAEDEQMMASARASIRVDDETAPPTDLPGVNRDTAGRVKIDSVKHKAPPDWDEGHS